jgi:sulfur carrier protein
VITVNGEPRDLPDGTVVAEVVTGLAGWQQVRGVAVAVNGEVVPRAAWSTTVLAGGDRVEVLVATQGG